MFPNRIYYKPKKINGCKETPSIFKDGDYIKPILFFLNPRLVQYNPSTFCRRHYFTRCKHYFCRRLENKNLESIESFVLSWNKN